jgi:hypothetical protein
MLALFGPLNLVSKIAGGFLVGALLLLSLAYWNADRRADKFERQAIKCAEGRKADRAAYETAQKDAASKNKAQVQKIESEQQRITANVEADLTARLERLRSELRRNATSQGSPRSPGAGGVPEAPGSANGEARVCLEADQLLRGAENEERHEQLIRWVEQQLKVSR